MPAWLLRWQVALASLPIGVSFCLLSLVTSPYTTYGWRYERVRPIAAEWSVNFATISLAALLLSAIALFQATRQRKRVWQVCIFGALAFFVTIDVYRIVWIEFVVLPQAGHEPRNWP